MSFTRSTCPALWEADGKQIQVYSGLYTFTMYTYKLAQFLLYNKYFSQ